MSKNRHHLRQTALCLAFGICFGGASYAQTNTAGAIAGHATSGDTITISNPSTGYSRTITVGADGNYRFSQLPTGNYTVSRNGGEARTTAVQVGTAANIDFVSAGGGTTTLGTVTVVGANQVNPIDVSSVESTTILTAEQIAKIPVARNATAVALLAPGTVRGDAAFGNLASFGGSSVAENQYYLNGFNITNTFNNLAFVQVPYEAIAEQQVKTGGYGAEFGRSLGGVINQISKRGGNEFHAGGSIYWEPERLASTDPSQFRNDGSIVANNSKDKGRDLTSALWASGALIKDRLFAYGLIQYGQNENNNYRSQSSGLKNVFVDTTSPTWLLKMDWNINDNNILEFTGFSDKRTIDTDYYSTNFLGADEQPERTSYVGTDYSEGGGTNYVLKYTGYLTDTFTISALAGHGEFSRSNYSVAANGVANIYTGAVGQPVAGCPIISDLRPDVRDGVIPPITGCTIANIIGRQDAKDTRDQYRIDLEWQLGDHLLRGGVDIDNFESTAGQSYSGGAFYRYGRYSIDGVTRDDVVRKRIFQSGATVAVDQQAYYIEDSWHITDNFVAYLGARWDTFNNKNGDGESYNKISNQFAPRLGFSWDVFGDSTFKVFGNAGRYALPLTATVAIRGASKSLFSEEYFSYKGVDPITGAPTGTVRVTNPSSGTPIRYLNNEFGLAKNPATIASSTLKPQFQDEYILGFQKQLNDNVSLGVRAIYRDLKTAIDDTCDYRPIFQYAYDHDIALNPENPGFPFCRLYNPGKDAVFNLDLDGDGTLEQVAIGAGDVWQAGNAFGIPAGTSIIGPEGKRSYSALEFFFQGNWDHLFLQGSYTYASSRGNFEGGVKSDNGQNDTGTTQDFDYPELAYGAYGYLPNDRRHTLKLFGNFEVSDEWSIGGNLLVQSGRPVNCFGFYGGFNTSRYQNAYFSCDSGPITGADGGGSNGYTIVPRGSAGRTPWTTNLDMNVAYKPAFADGNLMFKLDVFNILNSRKATTVNEEGEDAAGIPDPLNYKAANGWQSPRSVRFLVQYDF